MTAPAMDRDALAALLDSDFGPLARDFRVERADARGVRLRLCVRPHHLRPGGTVSGPAMFALVDVALYLAILCRAGSGAARALTVNCSIDFLRAPEASRDLLAEARLLRLGRNLAVGDVLVTSEGCADAVARAGLTYALPQAAERTASPLPGTHATGTRR